MIHIKMVINTDNAAFEDNGKDAEVKNIFDGDVKNIVSKFVKGSSVHQHISDVLHDSNGNTVGTIVILESMIYDNMSAEEINENGLQF